MSNDLGQQLRDADPLTRERALSTDDVHAMRRRIVSAAHDAPQRGRPGLQIAGAIVIACTVVVGLAIATRFRSDRGLEKPVTTPRQDEPRQLQFETPGGTRIIWVLNPNLEL